MNIAYSVGGWQEGVCVVDGTIPEGWAVHYGGAFKYITDAPRMSFSVVYSPPKCEYQGLGTDPGASLALWGGVAPLRGVYGDGFIKPSFARVFSNPAIGGVTIETPEVKPVLNGRGGGHVVNSINIIPVALPMITVFTHKQCREELVRKRSAVYVSYETDTLKGELTFKSRIKVGPYVVEPFLSASYSITYELMFKTDVTVSYISNAYTYEDSKQISLMRQPKLQLLSTVL
jgi:hypothetical protein